MKTTEEAADMVLKAAGSSLANYTMPATREAILAAVKAVQKDAAPQWLPIESAPKDKALIVIGLWNNDVPIKGCILSHWCNQRQAWFSHSGGFWFKVKPTHWQPLPTPPEAK